MTVIVGGRVIGVAVGVGAHAVGGEIPAYAGMMLAHGIEETGALCAPSVALGRGAAVGVGEAQANAPSAKSAQPPRV